MKHHHVILVSCAIVAVIFAGISINLFAVQSFNHTEKKDIKTPVAQKGPQPVLVETAQVTSTNWQDRKSVIATVKSIRYLPVRAEISGTILQIAPAGKQVPINGVLYHFDDHVERFQLKEKEAHLDMAKKNTKRADLLVNKAISQAAQQAEHVNLAHAVSEVEKFKNTLRKMMVTAPFAGVVSLHDLTPGQLIQEGQTLFSFYDPNDLYVEFSVPETDIGTLSPGVQININDTVAGFTGIANITLVNTEVNPINRTLTLRAKLEKGNFRHGSSVRVTYPASSPQMTLVIPKVAVRYSAYGQSVFVVKDNRVQIRSIITGDDNKGIVQVRKGLEKGELVVTAGQMRLYPDAPIRQEIHQ
ncbi:efflux RND transporter periplasmic adaptor subunit [Photorhabdus aegyptia]|uniref:RND family efflux transporter, MFP subunit n=1 Tax=Photorhabdus aegyptia TaxID=2805098 RepID=A0A022PKZ2_9GAMM|nr:efflux RND transporter periplasmic adaptor subunit [Photorhabdus aegyptia]EYU15638.1 RND family efflux transporter, MFP subunit [Photorhabdus aegyptia]